MPPHLPSLHPPLRHLKNPTPNRIRPASRRPLPRRGRPLIRMALRLRRTFAKYYLAMSQDRLGDTASAEKNLQEVADHGDPSIKGVAQFALAHLQALHGGTAKAIETLTQLYNSGNYPKSAVAFDLASLYEASGQQEQAKQYYGKVITDSPDSRFRQESESALKRMGAPVPVPPSPVPAKP